MLVYKTIENAPKKVFGNNRVKFPKDILLHCSVHQHGRRDVRCKPLIYFFVLTSTKRVAAIWTNRLGGYRVIITSSATNQHGEFSMTIYVIILRRWYFIFVFDEDIKDDVFNQFDGLLKQLTPTSEQRNIIGCGERRDGKGMIVWSGSCYGARCSCRFVELDSSQTDLGPKFNNNAISSWYLFLNRA